jgi:hypothetical protein
MRLWSLHPKYLDRQGLLGLWREGLLAQKVLKGETKGYRSHPQLARFKQHPDPLQAIAHYLKAVQEEAARRGYNFDSRKINPLVAVSQIAVTKGQVAFERQHLLSKLEKRDPERHSRLLIIPDPLPHPSLTIIPGEIASWEKVWVKNNQVPSFS